MNRILSLVRRCVEDYEMIAPGDRIAVGVSGGKDSLLLLAAMARLREFYPVPYEVEAITLDMGHADGLPGMDFSGIAAFCKELDVPYTILNSEIQHIIFDLRKEKNPCSMCAKMRRGLLHNTAKELGCNRVALGHHLDDAVETFYMNLWGEGRLGCFSPVTWLSRKELYLIRPMVLATEAEVRRAVRELDLPVVKSACPADGATRRQEMKDYVADMAKKDPAFRQKMLGALQDAGLDGWAPLPGTEGRSARR